MFSVFLLSYRNTRKSLGELEEAVETLTCGSCSHNISRSPKLPLVFLSLDRNTVHVFYFLNIAPLISDSNVLTIGIISKNKTTENAVNKNKTNKTNKSLIKFR